MASIEADEYVDTTIDCPECGATNEVQGYGVELDIICDVCGHEFTWPTEPPEPCCQERLRRSMVQKGFPTGQ